MKIKFLLSVVLCALLVSCAKKEDDPSAPVVNFFKAVNAGDSAGVINSVSSTLKEQYLKNPQWGVRQTLDGWKGGHAEITVKKIEWDETSPNTAKIHFKAVYTGKEAFTSDSVYLIVNKERNEWKLSSLTPQSE